MEYRLAFLLTLLTMALGPLGPSVIGLGPASVVHYEHLPIANLTMSKGLSPSRYQCIKKADEIVYFEVVQGGTYGYTTEMKQLLIPWPTTSFEQSQRVVEYESDVVFYDYDCRWPTIRFDNSQGATPAFIVEKSEVVILETPNISWIPWRGYTGMLGYSGNVLPLLNIEDDPLPLSAFLFIDYTSDPRDPLGTVKTWVPVPVQSDDLSLNLTNVDSGLKAAALLCDPHYTISRAKLTLRDGKLSANVVERPLLGNFPPLAANSMFSQAFLNVLSHDVGMSTTGVAPFTITTANKTLLTLPEINNNLNRVFHSAAKAYISGYAGQPGVFPVYTSFNQTATVQYPKSILLASSLPFLVALWVVDGVIILILAVLVTITNARELWLFSLQAMEEIYRDLPTGDEDLTSSQHSSPGADPRDTAKPPEFIWRMIVFMVLEVSFLVLAGYCSTNHIPIHLPSAISHSQAKSVTTAIVVAWCTLTMLPLKDIILLVFSAECISQYRRTGDLKPNVTDRVSHATSGIMDQLSHFLVGWPTFGYRLAFLLLVFVTLIGPLGPGVLTLSDVTTTCFQDLLVANISYDSHMPIVESRLYQRRAQLFVELELLEGRVYGYNTVAEGVLIPWPEPGLERSQNVTVYESDVVVYNYSCHWVQTKIDDHDILTSSVLPNGTRWTVLRDGGHFFSREGIFPLLVERPWAAGGKDGTTVENDQYPFFAAAFTGNSTLMDIGGTGTSIPLVDGSGPGAVAMSLSVLFCDPRYKIQRASVTLSSGQLRAIILPTLPLLGNFPKNVTDGLFSLALLSALFEDDLDRPPLTPISMFLFTGEFDGTGPLHPPPLSVINDNMNRAIKSAAKAYLSGYNSSEGISLANYSLWSQTATVHYQQTALVASRPFLDGLLALVIATVVVLVVLLKVAHIGKIELFHLQTLKKIYKDERRGGDD